MRKRKRHPVFKEPDFVDADDAILEVTGDAIPDFIDRLAGLKRKEDEEEE